MKKIYTLMFLLLVSIGVVCAQNVTGPFTLNGTIKKPNGTKAILSYNVVDEAKYIEVFDTVKVLDNKFIFSGYLNEPVRATLRIDDINLSFAIDANVMDLVIPDDAPNSFILEGSDINTYSVEEKRRIDNLYASIDDIKKKIDSPYEQNEEVIQKNKQILDSLWGVLEKQRIEYSKENLDYFFGLQYINFYMRTFPGGIITTEEARSLLNSYPLQFRQTHSGKMAEAAIKSRENTQVGAVAPNFVTKDIDGNTIVLSSFRNRSYVLIDVWASWCVACVRGFPHLKELYEKYHNKGLDIIAISRDENLEAWRNAIIKHEIENWHHILAEKEPGSFMKGSFIKDDIAILYPIIAVPKYYLIDKKGVVIGSWDGASSKNMDELDEILFRIFEDVE